MSDTIGTLWRHEKTNRVYVILGHCRLEATNARAILYREINGSDDTTWARDEAEFFDGRFRPVVLRPTPPASEEPEG